jgi:hypothetical protein
MLVRHRIEELDLEPIVVPASHRRGDRFRSRPMTSPGVRKEKEEAPGG